MSFRIRHLLIYAGILAAILVSYQNCAPAHKLLDSIREEAAKHKTKSRIDELKASILREVDSIPFRITCDDKTVAEGRSEVLAGLDVIESFFEKCDSLILTVGEEQLDLTKFLTEIEEELDEIKEIGEETGDQPVIDPTPAPTIIPDPIAPVPPTPTPVVDPGPSPLPPLPSTDVHAIAIYQGSYSFTGQSHSFCHSKRGAVAVNVTGSRAKTLILSSYEPVDWSISLGAEVSISKVIVIGYNPHKVLGLPDDTRVEYRTFYSYDKTLPGSGGQGAFVDLKNDPTGQIFHWAGQSVCAGSSALVPVENRGYLQGQMSYSYFDDRTLTEGNQKKIDQLMGRSTSVKGFQGGYVGKEFTISDPAQATSCAKTKLSVEKMDSGEIVKCEGYMPEGQLNAQSIWGTNPNGEYTTYGDGKTGPSCKSGNVKGAHYHTVTSAKYGLCNNYCTIIADCDAAGNWVNKRMTW